MACICSKSYFVRDILPEYQVNKKAFKVSAKGCQQANDCLTFANYKKCILNNQIINAKNIGLCLKDNRVQMYELDKKGLNFCYVKRRVFEDCITTAPLLI